MAKHKTFFGKLFGWIGDLFHAADKDLLKVAIDVTNKVKDFVNSPTAGVLTSIIPTDIDDKLVELLKAKLPLIVADELALQSLDADTTEDEAKDTAQLILNTFGGLSDIKKEEFYTSVAARLYIEVQAIKAGEKLTFGKAAALVESFYQQYEEMKNDD